MADGCSPSAIQAQGNRQYRLLESQEWDVYHKIAEQANSREEKEAKSKEAEVNRLIASIQANVPSKNRPSKNEAKNQPLQATSASKK